MGLLDLKTDLKSLRYGQDTPGGGDSGQPYIKSKIPEGLTSKSPDFLLRNGYLAPRDALTDVARLTKMFFDLKSPNGLLFTAKQNVLSATAAPAQGGTFQTPRLLNEYAYTPLSTLAQAGVVAFGTHLNKQGINPFAETGAYAKNPNLYFDKVKTSNIGATNRITTQTVVTQANTITTPTNTIGTQFDVPYSDIVYGSSNPLGDDITQISTSQRIDALFTNRLASLWYDKVYQKTDTANVLSYRGGPGSVLGVGTTNIRFADQRTGINSDKTLTGLETWKPNQEINREFTTLIEKETIIGASKAYATVNKLALDNDTTDGTRVYVSAVGLNAKLFNPLATSFITWTPNTQISRSFNNLDRSPTSNKFNQLTSGSNNDIMPPDLNPPSVYNVGPDQTILNNNDSILYANGSVTYNQKQIEETPYGESYINNSSKKTGAPEIQDFRKILREKQTIPQFNKEQGKKNGALAKAPDYSTENYERRVNIGGTNNMGPGNSEGKNLLSYTNGSGIGPIDKINALSIYRSENVDTNKPINDLVKFRIAAIDNNDPNFKTFMHFRAFIDSFSDSYTGEWDSVRYIGRGEKFYNYKGFDRTISLAFTVAAQSKQELIPMYKKLNYLASNLAPDYSEFGYMRGPLIELTMGGYLYNQVGFITQLTYDIPEDSPWEIGLSDDGGEDSTVKELSHMIRVTGFSFTPIHNFVPQKQGLGFGGLNEVTTYGPQRYIALAAGDGNNYDNKTNL